MNKGVKVIKTKMTKKDTRTFWRVVIITGVLLSLPVFLLLIRHFTPESIRDVSQSHNIEIATNSSSETSAAGVPTFANMASKAANPETYRKEAKTYYPTFLQAVNAYYPSGAINLHRISGKIFQFENKDAITAYYWCVNSGNGLGLCSVFSIKKDGEYSNLLESEFTFSYSEPAQEYTPFAIYTFTPEEAATFYLTNQCSSVDAQSISNSGVPTYLGISDNPRINNLRILGKPPTRIIKSSVRGRTYYIWIYEGLDIRGVLLNTKGFTFGKFTYGQLIDILHIHFASDSDPLSKNVPITTAN